MIWNNKQQKFTVKYTTGRTVAKRQRFSSIRTEKSKNLETTWLRHTSVALLIWKHSHLQHYQLFHCDSFKVNSNPLGSNVEDYKDRANSVSELCNSRLVQQSDRSLSSQTHVEGETNLWQKMSDDKTYQLINLREKGTMPEYTLTVVKDKCFPVPWWLGTAGSDRQ